MRRFCLLLAILCLFPSCGQKDSPLTVDTAAERMTAAYGADGFRRADEDFVLTSFGAPDYVERAEVYLSANGDGTEVGFFQLTNATHAAKMKNAIREYLASERQSIEALAALYPGDELNARLARFDSAVVEERGALVYYILADADQNRKISRAIIK